jgi:hypothetical protein
MVFEEEEGNSTNPKQRTEALKRLNRTIELAVRSNINNSLNDLIEDNCILIWNTALPLLQVHSVIFWLQLIFFSA